MKKELVILVTIFIMILSACASTQQYSKEKPESNDSFYLNHGKKKTILFKSVNSKEFVFTGKSSKALKEKPHVQFYLVGKSLIAKSHGLKKIIFFTVTSYVGDKLYGVIDFAALTQSAKSDVVIGRKVDKVKISNFRF